MVNKEVTIDGVMYLSSTAVSLGTGDRSAKLKQVMSSTMPGGTSLPSNPVES